jgi:polyphenol oxidase
VTTVRQVRLEYGLTDSFCEIPLAADSAAVSGLHAGISLARSGDMSFARRQVLPGRARLLSELGVGEDRVFGTRQVHSQRVTVVDGQPPAACAAMEADGMITDRPEAVLSATVADCFPIFLVDVLSGAFGLVHSGWKGTGIAVEALRAMRARYGTDPHDVAVTIGPGIGPCCYSVPEDRAAFFAGQFGAGAVVRDPDGRPRLDLREANLALLRGAGVQRTTVVTDCTSCSTALGSFRRQGAESFTLMLACIGRWESPAAAGGPC